MEINNIYWKFKKYIEKKGGLCALDIIDTHSLSGKISIDGHGLIVNEQRLFLNNVEFKCEKNKICPIYACSNKIKKIETIGTIGNPIKDPGNFSIYVSNLQF